MGADASIYGMIRPPERQPGPLDNYSALMQLRAMGDASELHGLQRDKLTSDLAEDRAFKSALSGWVPGAALPAEAVRASPTRAATMEKTRLESEKTRGEIDHKRIQTLAEQAKVARDQLAGVTDQPSYDAWRQAGIEAGHQAARQAPQVFDPQWQRQHLMTADKFIEQTTPKLEWKSDGQVETLWQVNPNAGKPGPVEGALKITKKMSPAESDAAKARWAQLNQPVWDSERGVYVSRPLVGPGGAGVVPAGGAPAAAAAPAGAPSVIPVANLPPKQSEKEKPPAGYRWSADGKTLEAIPGGPAEKPLTEHQGKATAFSMRMADANKVIGALEGGGDFDPAGLSTQLAGKTGLATPLNYLAPKDAQRYEQAKRNWVTANLRLESGAAIPEPELAQEYRKWFPIPGDAAEVITQKAAARKVAEQAMLVQAGPGKDKTVAPAGDGARPPVNTSGFKVIRVERKK